MLTNLPHCELFISEILQDENLSEDAQRTRRILLNNFRIVHEGNPQEFPFSSYEDGSDDNRRSSLGRSAQSDEASLTSDNQDDGAPEYLGDIPPVAAQDIRALKEGYLEKRRKDHSFFGSEWQKRWCVLNNQIFYYFGSERDKQQKGSFYISDYSVQLAASLRRDGKKNACFELVAPGRRCFQFTACSPQEAAEWVEQINIILRDMRSTVIPVDDEEDEDEEETYDDIEGLTAPPLPPPGVAPASQSGKWGGGGQEAVDDEDEDIYEVLPDEDFPDPMDESSDRSSKPAWSSDYANYYQGLWDCGADEPDELTFQRGDLIYIVSKEYNIHGWWVGELNGAVGIVPKDFLHPAYIL